MKTFFKEIEDIYGYALGIILSYLAPIFEYLKQHNPVQWLQVNEAFMANFMPTMGGAILFNLFQKEKLRDKWRSFMIVIIFNAYALEDVILFFNGTSSRGMYFFGAFSAYFLLQTIFNIFNGGSKEWGKVIIKGITDKIKKYFNLSTDDQES